MRFLIDECLTSKLVILANDRGYEAHHVVRLGMAGAEDWSVAEYAWEKDFVLVTNNRADYFELYAGREIHSGLVIIVPNVRLVLQEQLFTSALDYIGQQGELINQVLEVDFESGDVVMSVFDLPDGGS